MEQMKRFAVYYAPAAGDFADRAAAWLGRDARTGAAVAHPALGLSLDALTRDPRRYGFHGTIKPPFRLAEGRTASGLHLELDLLARRLAPVSMPGLRLTRIGGFLALVPEGDAAALGAFAAQVVEGIDAFRAPLNAAEVARRRPERLSPRQRELLDLWGYPYVMEEFRFHLTLTDRLEGDLAARAEQAAADWFTPVLPEPFVVAELCLFGEAEDGAFRLLHRYALSA